jgi:hypothetical protein
MRFRYGAGKALLSIFPGAKLNYENPKLFDLFFLGDINLSDESYFRLESRS